MSRRDFTERDIHMALDGELPAEERADYEAWLDANPEMKARSVRFEGDRHRLRETFAGVVAEPVPDRLDRARHRRSRQSRARPRRAGGRQPQRRPYSRRVASEAISPPAGLRLEEQAEDLLAEEAIAAHTIYAAEQRHAVEVGAGDKDHLLGWLSKRIGLTLIAPDLAAEGFELVGGRLLPAGREDRGPAALRGRGAATAFRSTLRQRGKQRRRGPTGREPVARAPSTGWTRAGAVPSSARCRRSGWSRWRGTPTVSFSSAQAWCERRITAADRRSPRPPRSMIRSMCVTDPSERSYLVVRETGAGQLEAG